MNIINSYADKENLPIGRPAVKESDINRVKRNLTVVPLRQRNQLHDNSNTTTSPFCFGFRKCANSPVTELTNTFTELAAHETSASNTPKRRLSLASSSGSPTPDLKCRLRSLASSTDDVPSNPNCVSLQNKLTFSSISQKRGQNARYGLGSAFRRFNSLPYGSNEASPSFENSNTALPRQRVISPLAQSPPKKPTFFIPGEDSSDSGIGKDEEFQFVAPCIPPERAQATNELSPILVTKSSGVIGSPDIHDSVARDHICCGSSMVVQPTSNQSISDSPLLTHALCYSQNEEADENDDGFLDLDDLEKQGFNHDMPDSIASMFTGKLMPTAKPSAGFMKGSLFKSPSVPSKINGPPPTFDIRKRVLCSKRPEPPRDNNTPVAAHKKRKGVVSDGNLPPLPTKPETSGQNSTARLLRCKSMVEHSANYELNKSENDNSLTGDFSKVCCLPLISGKHRDLKCITPETMAKLVQREYDDLVYQYDIIDCRFPYEFNGGHIKGALNIYTKEEIHARYLERYHSSPDSSGKRRVVIFHCEFSSERAPKLSRFLRNHDRGLNKDNYPNLCYPELYLLEGGYKAFFENYKALCEPKTYKPMLHKDHSEDLKTFRAKSKSWAGEEKKGFRTGLTRRL